MSKVAKSISEDRPRPHADTSPWAELKRDSPPLEAWSREPDGCVFKPSSIFHQVAFRQNLESGNLVGLPGLIATEFPGEQGCDAWCGLQAGAGVEEEGAGAAGKYVLEHASRLVAGGPDDLGGDVGQGGVERRAQVRAFANQLIQFREIGTVVCEGPWLVIGRQTPAVQPQ
jgi:hypothetical protein